MIEVDFTDKAKDDIAFFKKAGNLALLKKISALIKDIAQDPFTGIGKPEQLKHNLAGLWSRRINHEHRIIYEVTDDVILVHSLKGHYQ